MSWSPCPDPELGDRATAEAIKTIKPGAVNWMCAGRGIVHSERTAVGRRGNGQRLFGIQRPGWRCPRIARRTIPPYRGRRRQCVNQASWELAPSPGRRVGGRLDSRRERRRRS